MDIALRVQERIGGDMGITVHGDLDYRSAAQFLACVERSLLSPPATLYVDLYLTTFVDSGGLGALITARKHAERAGTRLILERPTPRVRRLLDLSGLLNFFGLPPA